jgi:hypothetical protein
MRVIIPISALAFVACTHSSGSTSSTTVTSAPVTSTPATGAPSEQARMPKRSPDPADALLDHAAALPLAGPQRAFVRSLQDEHARSKASAKAALGAFDADLAKQIDAGSMDMAVLRADQDAVMRAVTAHLDEETSAIDRLHATLTSGERQALVTAVRSDQSVMLSSPEASKGRDEHLARMTRMLSLDSEQQRIAATALDAQMKSEQVHGVAYRQTRITSVLDSFAKDDFRTSEAFASAGLSPAEAMRARLESKASFMAQLLPSLRPDQRTILANHINAIASGEEGER